jgi:uncharacterized membrane protein
MSAHPENLALPRQSAMSDLLRTCSMAALFLLALAFFAAVALPYLRLDGRLMPLYETRIPSLWMHVAFGSIALLIGPVQLWLGISGRTGRLHRWLGRTYVTVIAVSVVAAIHLALNTPLGPVFASGAFGLATAWTLTTAMAVLAILRRQVTQHRQWMIRSYVVTLAFVLFRIGDPVLEAIGMAAPIERATMMIWLGWSVPLLLTECVLQGRQILSVGKATVPSRLQ